MFELLRQLEQRLPVVLLRSRRKRLQAWRQRKETLTRLRMETMTRLRNPEEVGVEGKVLSLSRLSKMLLEGVGRLAVEGRELGDRAYLKTARRRTSRTPRTRRLLRRLLEVTEAQILLRPLSTKPLRKTRLNRWRRERCPGSGGGSGGRLLTLQLPLLLPLRLRRLLHLLLPLRLPLLKRLLRLLLRRGQLLCRL